LVEKKVIFCFFEIFDDKAKWKKGRFYCIIRRDNKSKYDIGDKYRIFSILGQNIPRIKMMIILNK